MLPAMLVSVCGATGSFLGTILAAVCCVYSSPFSPLPLTVYTVKKLVTLQYDKLPFPLKVQYFKDGREHSYARSFIKVTLQQTSRT